MTTRLAMAGCAAALLLGGCGTVNRGLESVHQPVVQRSDLAFDVATGNGGMAAGEQERLAGWLASLRLSYGDRISVDEGNAGYAAAGVRAQVSALAAHYGLMIASDAPLTPGQIAPGAARVIVTRTRASVPSCPDHSRVSGQEFAGNTQSNFGCAVNTNLAAMVARPEDLVRGQPGAPTTDTDAAFKAIDTLRKAPPTGAQGLKQESSGAGGSN